MLYQDYDDDDDEILGIEMTSSAQPLNTIHRKMSNIKNNYPTNRYVKHVQYWKLIRKILLGIVVLGILVSYVLSDYTITEKVLEEDHNDEDSFIQDYDSDNTKKEQTVMDVDHDDDDDDEAVLDNDTTKDWLKNKQKVTNEEWLKKKVSIEDGKQFEIVDSFVHDTDAFLEGLCYNPKDGYLYESVGLTGKSDIRKIDLKQNGTIVEKVIMEDPYFGEGLTLVDENKLIQLTYKKKVGFVYTIEPSLELLSNFTYDTGTGEGWGLTYNPNKKELILNDGGDYLIFWDASYPYKEKRRVKVKRQSGKPARQMNELEYWKDRIVANVWFEDTILIIHPETGECEKEYDLSSLAYDISKKRGHGACLNGISISSDPDLLYISGKLWDTIFLIRLL